jgi:hypothetical protein
MTREFRTCSLARAAALGLFLCSLSALPASAQGHLISVAPQQQITAKAGTEITHKTAVRVQPGYHVNSNAPKESFYIPLRLVWSAGPLQVAEVKFPEPKLEKFPFSEKPISVFTGEFEIVTKFKVPANAAPGLAMATGQLIYQACNDRMCFPKKTLDVKVPLSVVR